MSNKLSTTEIIAQGDYLEPDFNPSALTVAHLLGILGYHNVKYPSQYTKSKLVEIFNDEIKPKATRFKSERLSRQNSQASDEGIKDGITGRAIGGKSGVLTRGASRRESLQPADIASAQSSRPDPVKRRRSSAEPSLGGPPRRARAKKSIATLAEESEPEEVEVRKVSRNRKDSTEAGAQARRSALTFEEGDSGWEDNNIFQSGAESSSPVRAPTTRTRTRRSSAPKRPKKSMSVPPQFAPPTPSQEDQPARRTTRRAPSVRPPESAFEPAIPADLLREPKPKPKSRQNAEVPEVVVPRRTTRKPAVEVSTDTDGERSAASAPRRSARLSSKQSDTVPTTKEEDDTKDTQHEQEDSSQALSMSDDEQVRAVSQRISEGGRAVHRRAKTSSASNLLRFILALLTVGSLTSIYNHKMESAPIGFCETGKKTNDVLENLRTRRAAVEECNRENRTVLYSPSQADVTQGIALPTPTATASVSDDSQVILSEACPPLPLVPIGGPDACAPCPANAVCTHSTVTCDTGFLIRPHPILFFLSLPPTHQPNANAQNSYTLPAYQHSGSSGDKSLTQLAYTAISSLLDGFPGFGPVAFPPRCVEDPRRKRHIGALGKAVEAMLAAERGRRMCAGVGWKEEPGTEAEEAKKWGVDVETLKQALRKKTASHLKDAFDDTFNEAIQQLVVWGGVFVGEDAEGRRYLAHRTPQMDLPCALKVKARDTWDEWRRQIYALWTLILSIVYFRHRRTQNALENDRVAVLAQSALHLLRAQETSHHTDPVTSPHPYLSSYQLRDLVLQDEPSVSARRRLWARVEQIVEENANVRTNLEEVQSGNEERVWHWVGSAGKPLTQGE